MFLKTFWVSLVGLTLIQSQHTYFLYFCPTGNIEDSPTHWGPHHLDGRRTSPSQRGKAVLLYLDVLQSFIFYQRLGHLALVPRYETVPHIVVKDPQFFAPFSFLICGKSDAAGKATWVRQPRVDTKSNHIVWRKINHQYTSLSYSIWQKHICLMQHRFLLVTLQ